MTNFVRKHFATAVLASGAVLAAGSAAKAQDNRSVFGKTSASVTYGPYAKFELGGSRQANDEGFWHPPGPADPDVFFDLSNENTGYGSAAIGFDWMNGFRGDLSISVFGDSDVSADWSRTVPFKPGPHASVETSTKSTAFLMTGHYSPLEHQGKNVLVQPFLSAGIGFSRNTMSDWVRSNPASMRPVREFEGDTSTEFAWSVGFGVAYELKRERGKRPILVEAGYKYFDLGTVTGGATALPGNGSSSPIEPFQFDNQQHVLSIGIRIPLQKY
jgi:opacity protein-like surface antigen